MATITGITAVRANQILGESIVSGSVSQAGNLILTRRNGETVNAGSFIDIVTSVMEDRVDTQLDAEISEKLPVAVSNEVFNKVRGEVFNRGDVTGSLSFDGITDRTLVHAMIRARLVGNITVNAANFPAGVQPGTQFVMILTQDGTGGRTLTLTGIKRSMGVLALSTNANAVDMITFMYDGTAWYAGAAGLRFS